MAIVEYYDTEAYAQKMGIELAVRQIRKALREDDKEDFDYWLRILLDWVDSPQVMYLAGAGSE